MRRWSAVNFPILLYLCLLYQNCVVQECALATTKWWISVEQKILRWDSHLMLVRQAVTSETLWRLTPVEMLALYSCMCTYIYPAYIIYYSQLQYFLLTKKLLLDRTEISTLNPNTAVWRKYFHLLMRSLFWQYKNNPNFKEKTSIFFKLLSKFFLLNMEKQKQTKTNAQLRSPTYRFSCYFSSINLGKNTNECP